MLERDIEAHYRDEVKAAGGIAYKFTSPQRRSVPDRLQLMPIAPEHREIVAKYVKFREIKAPGKAPTEAQLREHVKIRALGYYVDVIDSKQGWEL